MIYLFKWVYYLYFELKSIRKLWKLKNTLFTHFMPKVKQIVRSHSLIQHLIYESLNKVIWLVDLSHQLCHSMKTEWQFMLIINSYLRRLHNKPVKYWVCLSTLNHVSFIFYNYRNVWMFWMQSPEHTSCPHYVQYTVAHLSKSWKQCCSNHSLHLTFSTNGHIYGEKAQIQRSVLRL